MSSMLADAPLSVSTEHGMSSFQDYLYSAFQYNHWVPLFNRHGEVINEHGKTNVN